MSCNQHSCFWFWLPFTQNEPYNLEQALASPYSGWNTGGRCIPSWLYLIVDPQCEYGYLVLKTISVHTPNALKSIGKSNSSNGTTGTDNAFDLILNVLAFWLNVLGLAIPFLIYVYFLARFFCLDKRQNVQNKLRMTLREKSLVLCHSVVLFTYFIITVFIHQTRPLGSCVRIPGMPSGHTACAIELLSWFLAFRLVIWKNDRRVSTYEIVEEQNQSDEESSDIGESSALDSNRRQRPSIFKRFELWLRTSTFALFFIAPQLALIPWARFHVRDHAVIQILYGGCIGVIISLVFMAWACCRKHRNARGALSSASVGSTAPDLRAALVLGA